MQTASANVDPFMMSLEAIDHESLDAMRLECVEEIVHRIVREPNDLMLETAPFQSAI